MVAILDNPDFTDTEFAELVDLLNCHGGIAYTHARAADHIRAAKAMLDPFESGPMQDVLVDIADYALVRKA
jgi:geranylgeranyl pyrophosphate synthase